MMLVVVAVTSATLYLAGNNLRTKQQEKLEAQFQNEVRSYLALQETRLSGINEKCRVFSHSVRIRAALEERDIDDLYRNALTELRDVLAPPSDGPSTATGTFHASFVRFLDPDGAVLPPGAQPLRIVDQPGVDPALEAAGAALRSDSQQSSGLIALNSERQLSALRQIVVTKIIDWNGASLGALVLGFPVQGLQVSDENPRSFRAGIFFNRGIYVGGISPFDRMLLTKRINESIQRHQSNNFELELESSPQLVVYKALDRTTKFQPAYAVCLFPMADAMHEMQALRWKIITFGAFILCAGFAISLLLVSGLAKPVDQIVAGSAENFARRQEAEENLRAANQELEKALSELKATQRQMIQQERLRALGQMASGIAHDFNNTLTPILGFSEILLTDEATLRNPVEARRLLEMLNTSAHDAASVVSRLREFYRPLEADKTFPAVNLTRIVQQAVSLTEPKWKAQAQASGVNIEVGTSFHADAIVAGEEAALREVLTNLIFNAVDAMPNGGRLNIEVSVEDARAILRLRDTGIGMTEEIKQRCLEPFFSTKGERGTGLGLSMVYGIIERHRGRLDLESAPGQGTTFTISLPIADLVKISPPAQETPDGSKSSFNILVVDDDERVCEVVAHYLRGDGHNVAMTTSGREAITQAQQKRFDLIFLDRAMPQMSGDQTAELIKQLNPTLPIIMLTGFGALIEATGSQPRAVDAVLGKPVTLGTLRETIDKFVHAGS
jgi:signal transduction histidine kinase